MEKTVTSQSCEAYPRTWGPIYNSMVSSSDAGNYGTPPMPSSATTSIDTHASSTTTEDSGSQLVFSEETVRLLPVTAVSDTH